MDFKTATTYFSTIVENVDSDWQLHMYGLYKQALYGDNQAQEPFWLNKKKHAKWKAWMVRKGWTSEKAKKTYIRDVERLKSRV